CRAAAESQQAGGEPAKGYPPARYAPSSEDPDSLATNRDDAPRNASAAGHRIMTCTNVEQRQPKQSRFGAVFVPECFPQIWRQPSQNPGDILHLAFDLADMLIPALDIALQRAQHHFIQPHVYLGLLRRGCEPA